MDLTTSETRVTEGYASFCHPPSHQEPSAQKPGQSAAHAVLFTPELLCNVIVQLPLEDIVTATGVCHFCRNAAAAEPEIQKALYLKPEEVRRVLLYQEREHLDEEATYDHSPGAVVPLEYCATAGKLHPFLSKICGISFAYPDRYGIRCRRMPWPDFKHYTGTWRHIFISQPPRFKVSIGFHGLDLNNVFYDDPNGVRFGGLYDAMSSRVSGSRHKTPDMSPIISRYSIYIVGLVDGLLPKDNDPDSGSDTHSTWDASDFDNAKFADKDFPGKHCELDNINIFS